MLHRHFNVQKIEISLNNFKKPLALPQKDAVKDALHYPVLTFTLFLLSAKIWTPARIGLKNPRPDTGFFVET